MCKKCIDNHKSDYYQQCQCECHETYYGRVKPSTNQGGAN